MSRREPAASPFSDLSNLSTPKPNPNPKPPSPLFFTASRNPLPAPTPTPLRRRRPIAGAGAGAATPTPLGRRLRALELDQSRSARRAESGRERTLRAFAATATSWLSLLLRDPSACGCSPATATATAPAGDTHAPSAGKRDTLDGERSQGRSPKRHRGVNRGGERKKGMTPAMAAALRESLREVCSLEDVSERMGKYMSPEACEEVLIMMCHICKNIDDNRLKMKAHCPIATDLRLKEKATRIFMCYNPEWLRIGLHIVLGGDSLIQNGSWKRDKEVSFLKLILEKQLFAQNVTAKSCAHKLVERNQMLPTEALGSIILKRIFLLVVALDKAKVESALPLKSGIDGIDGGSPLLFCHQTQIKSSRQIIQETLGEVMHGEGDFVMHLTAMGYKLNYQQLALTEYDFTIANLFEDLRDGIILCRVVQLLLSDASIMLKAIAPSDTRKKKLHNCTVAIQFIKEAGVPISDADGVTISAEDIAIGDKELILSLLWNLFIHMQLPLLANRTSLVRELSRLKAPVTEQPLSETKSHIGLLYDWIGVICAKYDISVEGSFHIDRPSLNYFIKYYLNMNIHKLPLKETLSGCRKELFSCHESDTITDMNICQSSSIGKALEDFLQGFPASGILGSDLLFDEKSAIVLLAFLSPHLTNDRRLEELKNFINTRLDGQSLEIKISARRRSRGKNDIKYRSPQKDNMDGSYTRLELATIIIQTQARRYLAKNNYHKLKNAIPILQGAMKAWSSVMMKSQCSYLTVAAATPCQARGNYYRYLMFILERHRFVRMRRSSIVIQQAVRIWIRERRRHEKNEPFESHEFSETTTSFRTDCITPELCNDENGTIASPNQQCKDVGTSIASCAVQCLSFDETACTDSATSVKHDAKGSSSVTSDIQQCNSGFDSVVSPAKLACDDDLDCGSDTSSEALYQHEQPVFAQFDFLFCKEAMAARKIQIAYRRFIHNRTLRVYAAIKIQSYWRGFSMRVCFIKQVQASIAIQSVTRHILCCRAFHRYRDAAILIQRFTRGRLARKRLHYRDTAIVIQRWWRNVLFSESRNKAVIVIQSHVRGWIARQGAVKKKKCITIIQSYAKAYLVRKASRQEIADIRLKLQKSCMQVDDNKRLINRLVAALKQLDHCRSISIIRQTCATLSFSTEHSERCCETLVGAGAVDILLKQIHLLNRGVPDQEVLKQVFCTLRNIARYPNLRSALTCSPQSVEIIFKELLRNKADVFYITCDIMKKMCESMEGHEIAEELQHHVRRLGSLIQDLERKVELDKRNGRIGVLKENNLRRLGEAVTLYHLLTNGRRSC